MKEILKISFKALLVVMFAVVATIQANAQGNPGGPGSSGSGTLGNGQPSSGSPAVPFDGGMSLMLAASGIGYAAKKMKRNRK